MYSWMANTPARKDDHCSASTVVHPSKVMGVWEPLGPAGVCPAPRQSSQLPASKACQGAAGS